MTCGEKRNQSQICQRCQSWRRNKRLSFLARSTTSPRGPRLCSAASQAPISRSPPRPEPRELLGVQERGAPPGALHAPPCVSPPRRLREVVGAPNHVPGAVATPPPGHSGVTPQGRAATRGWHSSAHPFPELLLLLGLFPHVQLQRNKRQSSPREGELSDTKFSPPQPRSLAVSRAESEGCSPPRSPTPALTWATAAK